MSCKPTEQDPTFPITGSISQELMQLEGITTPEVVEIKSPYLIVENMKQSDSLFHIYDLRDGKLKYAFGQKGVGPGEFTAHWLKHSLSDYLTIINDRTLFYYNINKDGMATLNFTKSPQCIESIFDIAFINDSTFVVDAQYMAPDLHIYQMQDEIPKNSFKYRNSNIMDPFMDINKARVYANEKRIILIYEYKKEIDFMDTEFNLIKKVKFNYPVPDNSLLGEEDCNSTYTYGYVGKQYFYVNYFGTSWKKHREKDTCGTYIEIYDFDGNPVARYLLNGKRPINFVVDERTFTLYGCPEDNYPEDNLLVYQLKGIR